MGQGDIPPVIRGFLLEDYPGGTLKQVLQDSSKRNIPLGKWALQIAEGLNRLHLSRITHMDVKPLNVVIASNDNAVLIDISGIRGVPRAWLAPELRGTNDPFSLSFEERQCNGIWAYRRLLSLMAESAGDSPEAQLLGCIATETAKRNSSLRLELCHVISRLRQLGQ
ncbi:hypothetical protein AOQ84DRAFT_379325 [Glonium stellatum]|uniref:Protein kinase domain-containing protein n=1 Tax=Glonium stellatum TaxID=574774 RepID=A0A8E2EVZ0_9PEZI|nr:hypothetical protein AOQ84DRAFT_379325 [Glonium stellatum]